ncbi:esterase/lipase family protein [Thermoactinospora rubra]|uniref:esterase/lipase family protein n=1 Tax=Thermoactinospora rubra TaxID=1088767 RepID=UPI000A115074|nr:lipase [Thermoactinospora rubra]
MKRRLASRVAAALVAFAATVAGASAPAEAMTGSVTLEASYSTGLENGWALVERYRDNSSAFVAETYPPDGRGDHTGQTRRLFGDVARPHSSRFLLYHAPGWQTNPKATPVLLVHGANQTADLAWANPNARGSYGCGQADCPTTGLMQHLSAAGYKVFAIGFPHVTGDGYYWAEQIGDAVRLIRAKTGAAKVDVIGWSKGAFNARMYVSSLRKSWGTAYAGDVRKLILVGGPNKGFDWGYRHGWTHDFAIFPECGGSLNAPAPHSAMICYGLWRSHPELSYEGNAYPGSDDMLYRWDDVYPLPAAEQDWYTTYYGGTGFYTQGRGIQWAIDRGSLVMPLIAAGTPSGVPVYQLCGNRADMALLHNEHTGPSDGAVFVASCSAPDGVANRAAVATLPLNHLKLGWASEARTQITTWLG